jgi:hypothetical protein
MYFKQQESWNLLLQNSIFLLDLRGCVLNFPVFITHQFEFMPLHSNQNQLPAGSLIFTDRPVSYWHQWHRLVL